MCSQVHLVTINSKILFAFLKISHYGNYFLNLCCPIFLQFSFIGLRHIYLKDTVTGRWRGEGRQGEGKQGRKGREKRKEETEERQKGEKENQ